MYLPTNMQYGNIQIYQRKLENNIKEKFPILVEQIVVIFPFSCDLQNI